jgi:hydroxymethylbilane synthase
MRKSIKIGTRGSQLALWQANWVKSALESSYPGLEITLELIKTKGDKILDVPLARVGGKGLFVKEIEEALIKGQIDLAVHSMKDVPIDVPELLWIKAITEREDPRDVIISKRNKSLADLPERAKIGTSSLRRQCQLLNFRPDFQIIPLRGNVNTRLNRLETDDLDAIVLAAAGVKRMGWEARITEYLSEDVSLPAIGQGALGIECRRDDVTINELVARLNHKTTALIVTAERAFLRRLEGGCQVPIACYGKTKNDALHLKGLVSTTDGKRLIRAQMAEKWGQEEKLGINLAEQLLAQGAVEILKIEDRGSRIED